MLLSRYPIAGLGRFQHDMDKVLDSMFDGLNGRRLQRSRWFPPLNIWEDDECIFAEAEVPGLSMDHIEIYITGNELTIKGQRDDTKEEGVKYHCRERRIGSFERTLLLPFDVDVEKAKADLKDGILTVKLPKAETAKTRTIKVTSN